MGDAVALKGPQCAAHGALVNGSKRPVDAALVRELVDAHHRFIWRLLGRLGVREADLDDAAQQVFMVLTQRSDLEIFVGSEQAFLFGVALKVARTHRRAHARRRESGSPAPEVVDASSSPETLTEQHRARVLLNEILESMPVNLRLPFVLFELDDVSSAEIAKLLDVPMGTVASRLRRAREWFQRRVQQLQAQQLHSRGGS